MNNEQNLNYAERLAATMADPAYQARMKERAEAYKAKKAAKANKTSKAAIARRCESQGHHMAAIHSNPNAPVAPIAM